MDLTPTDYAWVQADALIADDAYIGGRVRVFGDADVTGDARIEGEARIGHKARVSSSKHVVSVVESGTLWTAYRTAKNGVGVLKGNDKAKLSDAPKALRNAITWT